MDAAHIIPLSVIVCTNHTVIGHRVQPKLFTITPSDKRFIFKRGCIRADVWPVSHTSAMTPAARALEQAAVRTIPGCRRGRRARWRKKQTKRSTSSQEKSREARRALGFPLLQRHDSGFATYIYSDDNVLTLLLIAQFP